MRFAHNFKLCIEITINQKNISNFDTKTIPDRQQVVKVSFFLLLMLLLLFSLLASGQSSGNF